MIPVSTSSIIQNKLAKGEQILNTKTSIEGKFVQHCSLRAYLGNALYRLNVTWYKIVKRILFD